MLENAPVPHPQSKKARAARARRARARAESNDQLSKREERLARQLEARRRKVRLGRWRRARNVLLGTAAVAVVMVGGWLAFRPDPELDDVSRPRNRGGGHVTNASYDTPTPTSGPHDARAPQCTTYRDPLESTLAVHALEHGAIVLWYDASRPELADQLVEATERWDSHVLISANSDIDAPIVATAWNRLKEYQPGDDEIDEFIETYRRRGPERVDCEIQI